MEPPTKISRLDHTLCLKCQTSRIVANGSGDKILKLVELPEIETYERFLAATRERASYENEHYMALATRLRDVSAADLHDLKVSWHRECYSDVTNTSHIRREKFRFECGSAAHQSKKRGRPRKYEIAEDEPTKHTTRTSDCESFNPDQCFYCQNDIFDSKGRRMETHRVLHDAIATQIIESINAGNDEIIRARLVQLSGGLLVSRDDVLCLVKKNVLYHLSCRMKSVRYAEVDTGSEDVDFEASKISEKMTLAELKTDVQQTIRDADSLMSTVTLRETIEIKTESLSECCDSADVIVKKIETKPDMHVIPGVNRYRRRLIETKMAEREGAFDRLQRSANIDLEIDNVALRIRTYVLRLRREAPWRFDGRISSEEIPADLSLSDQLVRFLDVLMNGPVSKIGHSDRAERRMTQVEFIASLVTSATKTPRQISHVPKNATTDFRHMVETPFNIGLSLWMYYNFRSHKLIHMMYDLNCCVSYPVLCRILGAIAYALQETVKKYGVFIPPNMKRNVPIRGSLDNTDSEKDSVNGKGSIHVLTVGVYQKQTDSVDTEHVYHLFEILQRGKSLERETIPESVVELSPCSFKATDKPTVSPVYPSFELGLYKDIHDFGVRNDETFFFAKSIIRLEIPDPECYLMPTFESHDARQTTVPISSGPTRPDIGVWSSYFSMVSGTSDRPTDDAYVQSMINYPPQNMTTVLTGLEQLEKLNKVLNPGATKIIVGCDMAVYKRALKLQYLDQQYQNRWVLIPGPLHVVICVLRCLGVIIRDGGIGEVWDEANEYSPSTSNQILDGNHHNRAIDAHIRTYEALHDLWLESFGQDHHDELDSLESSVDVLCNTTYDGERNIAVAHSALMQGIMDARLESILEEYDRQRSSLDPMYKYIRYYMQQVLNLLQLIRSVRNSNFEGYLAALEELCPLFFQCNRLDYAQHVPEFVARMQKLKNADPDVWAELSGGAFTVHAGGKDIGFVDIGLDHGHEHLNKMLKGEGGFSDLSEDKLSLLQYLLNAPVLSALGQEFQSLIKHGKADGTATLSHHKSSATYVRHEQDAVLRIRAVLRKCGVFQANRGTLYRFMSNEVVEDKVQTSMMGAADTGREVFVKFVDERIIGGDSLWAKMSKIKILRWSSDGKSVKVGSDNFVMKVTNDFLLRLAMAARAHRPDVDFQATVSNYEFATTNKYLFRVEADGLNHLYDTDNKAKLRNKLLELHPECTSPYKISLPNSCLILDAMAVVIELLAVKPHANCRELAMNFTQMVDCKGAGYQEVRVVFDNYSTEQSIKESKRRKRHAKTSPKAYVVTDQTKIKGDFLASSKTKSLLTVYLGQYLIKESNSRVMVVTQQGIRTNFEAISTMCCTKKPTQP